MGMIGHQVHRFSPPKERGWQDIHTTEEESWGYLGLLPTMCMYRWHTAHSSNFISCKNPSPLSSTFSSRASASEKDAPVSRAWHVQVSNFSIIVPNLGAEKWYRRLSSWAWNAGNLESLIWPLEMVSDKRGEQRYLSPPPPGGLKPTLSHHCLWSLQQSVILKTPRALLPHCSQRHRGGPWTWGWAWFRKDCKQIGCWHVATDPGSSWKETWAFSSRDRDTNNRPTSPPRVWV